MSLRAQYRIFAIDWAKTHAATPPGFKQWLSHYRHMFKEM